DDLRAGAGTRGGRGREAPLVGEVDEDFTAGNQHGVRTRQPDEVGMSQQAVITGDRGEVVAPGVAMSLWEEDARVELVDVAVAILVGDVVVLLVRNLSVATGEVPDEPVVHRGGTARGFAAAQQRQLLAEQGVDLIL